MKKIINIINTAYRASIEEQDDTSIWICHAMKSAGADMHVLLRGNAVNYLVQGQDSSGISFGEWVQTQPPSIDKDIIKLSEAGVTVYFLKEDADKRGLNITGCAKPISLSELPKLLEEFDQVWHW